MNLDLNKILSHSLKNFKTNVIIVFSFIFFSLIITFFSTPKYASSFSFFSEGDNQLGLLSKNSIASSILGSSFGSDINILPLEAVVTSKELIVKISNEKFNYEDKNLLFYEIFKIENSIKVRFLKLFLSEKEYEEFLIKLSQEEIVERIKYTKDLQTNVIKVTLLFETRELADDVSHFIINYVNDYYNNISALKANDKTKYIDVRLQELEQELDTVYKNYIEFKNQNKNISSSPILMVKEQQLQQDISLKKNVYVQLSSQFEIYKMNSIDKSKTVYLVNSPTVSSFPADPNIILNIATFIFLSLLFIFLRTVRKINEQ
tara:strand:+ start:1264 stop:2217 length:954 start_codon:yes stop_codon:yes gene_type:complete